MGHVYRGRHRAQGVPVAIKVLSQIRAREAEFHQAFAAEVEVIAGLDHPGVLLVFDHGLVSAEAEKASDGELVKDSPYLVMELASGGSLLEDKTARRWPGVRAILLGMLDALAHAHAHGVIHRDVKRGNILIATEDDLRPGLKLSDFGLAHHRGDERTGLVEEALSGTPAYMAPEQCQGKWRNYGPWTDLYALGCVGWALTTGKVPFWGMKLRETLEAHAYDPLPRLAPGFPTPDGLEDWLCKALAKDPRRRFRCAADAAEELLVLAEHVEEPPAEGESSAVSAEDAPTIPANWALEVLTTQARLRKQAAPPVELSGVMSMPDLKLPGRGSAQLHRVPDDWRRPEGGRSVRRLVGAGLGLYGLKRIPVVDQEPVRDALWAEFGATHRSDVPRIVLLEGPTGSGKTRIVEWLGYRAVELGLATLITVTHSSPPHKADGLGPAIARFLRLEGLSRAACRPRVSRALRRRGVNSNYDARALLEIVAPDPDDPDAIRFSGANERFATISRFLEAEARDRPLLVVLEDAHRSPLAVTFARFLSRRRPLRALVVLSMNPDDPTQEGRVAGVSLESARTLLPDAVELTIGPLPVGARRELVQELLGLTPALARRVFDRTGGSPMFAVELVGDWVRRDLIVPTGRGYRLRDGVMPELPRGIQQLCAARVRRSLRGTGPDAETALELAAALGERVDDVEWRAVCDRAAIPEAVVGLVLDRLGKAGLLEPTPTGWAFMHGAVHECVERRCEEEGRAEARHSLCADVLAELGASPARLGRHLLRACRWEAAFDPLILGARDAATTSDLSRATDLTDEAERALHHLSPASPDRRVAELLGLRAELLQFEGRLIESGKMASRCLILAEAGGWAALAASAAVRLGTVRLRGGEIELSRDLFGRAAALFVSAADLSGEALAEGFLARACAFGGDLTSATAAARRAMTAGKAAGDPVSAARAKLVLSELLRRAGELDSSRAAAEEAVATFEAAGRRTAVAEALSALAETLRAQGELAEAEALYRRSQKTWDDLGSREAVTVDINLAILALLRGNASEARVLLEGALEAGEDPNDRFLVFGARILLLPTLTAEGEWDRVQDILEQLKGHSSEERFVDPDLAWAAEVAALDAARASHPGAARRTAEIAIAQRSGLGDRAAVARLEAFIASL
jgi:serine/threonine protein kinase/tetratricopeptide (TPR) repeat protein